jgi:hypothetical protein
MDKIEFVKVAGIDGIEVEHAIIDNGDGSFTSMTKAEYNRRQAETEQSTPSLTDEAATK